MIRDVLISNSQKERLPIEQTFSVNIQYDQQLQFEECYVDKSMKRIQHKSIID